MSSREKLSDDAIAAFLAAHPGWLRDGSELRRSYKFADFSSALGFVVRVGLAAEKRDHHPDVLLGWGRAEVRWTTHDRGGITSLDVDMADTSDRLYAQSSS
jgi:4a-hydroxytetrahydrobiopterin dehydratase